MNSHHSHHRNFLNLAFFALLFTMFAPVAAQQVIDNREPKPNEIGYHPAPGETVALNPPSMIWLHESPAAAYAVQWSRDAEFDVAETARGFRWNTYTHHETWPPGSYYWRYQFQDDKGEWSKWSAVREFALPPGATAFPMPTVEQQRGRVPEGRPRLFLRPEDLPRVRDLAKGELRESFSRLREEADRLLKSEPTPEPEHMGSARDKDNEELVKYWWPNRVRTLKACQEAETLAFVYMITREPEYGEAARRWILHLASWDPDGPTQFRMNCEAAKPLIHRLPRAYDWAWDRLTPEERERVQKVMLRRATDAWESWEIKEGVGHLNSPYGSHANRIWHKLGECAIAFLGEIPEAEMWLDYAVNKFYSCYPVWSDDDGGWHEGVNYWAGYMSKAVWWLQVAESAMDIDGFQKPFFAKVGDFPLYVAPPGSPNMGFGDLSYRPVSSGWGGFLEYFVRAQAGRPSGDHAGYWRWWMDQWNMRGESGILGFLYESNLPELPPARPPVDLPSSKVFEGIGVASLHTSLADASEDVHFLFKSSPFGTQSHGHNPHNSFQLNAYGEPLLTTCVYRDLHGSRFHYQWAHSTQAHNAVLVNGEGQIKHTPAPHGRIVDSQFHDDWDYVVGDATEAYGNRLNRYRRHVVFAKPDWILLYDDLEAKEPATFQFMLHALQPFEIDEAERSLKTRRDHAGVDIRYLPDGPLAFRQWDGYDPKPARDFPNQWHVEAAANEKRRHCAMLALIAPYRSGSEKRWSVERLETDTAIGVRITEPNGATLIGLRKHGVQGAASLNEIAFDDAAMVKRE